MLKFWNVKLSAVSLKLLVAPASGMSATCRPFSVDGQPPLFRRDDDSAANRVMSGRIAYDRRGALTPEL